MKNIFKKLIITVCAVSVTMTVASISVFATSRNARSGPNDTSSVTDTVKSDDNTSTSASRENAEAPSNVTEQANQSVPAKKYLTKWGGFFWFLLSVIVNFILSCWISNRFYRLAKRNTQGSAEIRALRKDIEEKFASTLTDINEPVTEVINRNENYARTDEGMEMPERKSAVEINDEEREVLGKWDKQRNAAKTDDVYEMRRAMSQIRFEDEDEEKDTSPSKMETITKAGNKAKDFLSNIFPFEE